MINDIFDNEKCLRQMHRSFFFEKILVNLKVSFNSDLEVLWGLLKSTEPIYYLLSNQNQRDQLMELDNITILLLSVVFICTSLHQSVETCSFLVLHYWRFSHFSFVPAIRNISFYFLHGNQFSKWAIDVWWERYVDWIYAHV